MNFSLPITLNQTALLRLVAALIGTAGMVSGAVVERLPRHVRQSILYVLRPAEAAALRLIVMVAQEMTAQGLTPTPRAAREKPSKPIPRSKSARRPALPLSDPRRRVATTAPTRYAAVGPRIRFFDDPNPVFDPPPHEPSPDDPVPAARLCGRLLALQAALGDLAKQGRRLMRMQARQARAGARPIRPMRPGRPPGHRARGRHEVDELLRECHQFALRALAAPDTS